MNLDETVAFFLQSNFLDNGEWQTALFGCRRVASSLGLVTTGGEQPGSAVEMATVQSSTPMQEI